MWRRTQLSSIKSMLGNKQEEASYKETTQDIKKQGFVNREIYAKWMPCGIYVNNLSRMVLFWNLLFKNKHHKQHLLKVYKLAKVHGKPSLTPSRVHYLSWGQSKRGVSVICLSVTLVPIHQYKRVSTAQTSFTTSGRRERKVPSHFTRIQEEKKVFYECKVDLL